MFCTAKTCILIATMIVRTAASQCFVCRIMLAAYDTAVVWHVLYSLRSSYWDPVVCSCQCSPLDLWTAHWPCDAYVIVVYAASYMYTVSSRLIGLLNSNCVPCCMPRQTNETTELVATFSPGWTDGTSNCHGDRLHKWKGPTQCHIEPKTRTHMPH